MHDHNLLTHATDVLSADFNHTRVLVADPDSDTRDLYDQAFSLAKCDVIRAADGREALVRALAAPPAIVVTELRLPIIDGFALCEILRRDALTAGIPIVVVTGESREQEIDRARRLGADVVLAKPQPPDVMLREMQQLLGRSRELRGRSASIRARAHAQLERSTALLGRPKRALSKAHLRFTTTMPPVAPPVLLCPSCDQPLRYVESHVGGVSEVHAEQWDEYECAACGMFQYRQRTRKLRRVG